MARIKPRLKGTSAAVLLLAVAALALAAPASGDATWRVRGAGYGHGVGMSAYGAYGYGRHGFGYRRILDSYFRHLRITTMNREPLVRVLLDVAPGDVAFTNTTSACGRALRPERTYQARRRGSSVQLVSSAGKTLAHCGKRLRAEGRSKIQVNGLGTYRGSLLVLPTESSSTALNVINTLAVNDYVRGSVPAEVPPSWPRETLKAMAVASRSIALSADVGGDGFELYPDTRTQVYGGVGVESPRTDRAVRDTFNQVATYRGEIAQTTYFSASGGITESRFLGGPQVPYLKSVKDPYDYYSPLHRWTLNFSQAEIDSRLGSYVDGTLRKIDVTKRGDSPRIESARLVGTAGTTTIRGDTLASALGLYDRWAFFKRQPHRGAQPAAMSSVVPGSGDAFSLPPVAVAPG